MAKRVAEFLKVSFEQFGEGYRDSFGECDEKLIREVYDSLKLPRRATRGSAGYDFFCPDRSFSGTGETVKIPTGIRIKLQQTGC